MWFKGKCIDEERTNKQKKKQIKRKTGQDKNYCCWFFFFSSLTHTRLDPHFVRKKSIKIE